MGEHPELANNRVLQEVVREDEIIRVFEIRRMSGIKRGLMLY